MLFGFFRLHGRRNYLQGRPSGSTQRWHIRYGQARGSDLEIAVLTDNMVGADGSKAEETEINSVGDLGKYPGKHHRATHLGNWRRSLPAISRP